MPDRAGQPNAGEDFSLSRCSACDGVIAGVLGLLALVVLLVTVQLARPGYLAFSDCAPYIVQAQTFAQGRLATPAPPEEEADFFAFNGMVRRQGVEFSRQPPGASAVYAALLLLLSDIRFAPPVVSALAVAISFLFLRRIADRKTGILAVLLCLTNLQYLMVASGVLSYPLSALLVSAALLVFTYGIDSEGLRAPFFCGTMVGLLFVVRPFTSLLLAVALGMSRVGLFRSNRGLLAQSASFLLGVLPGIAILLLHNQAVTGDFWPLAFTLQEPLDVIGFGRRGLGGYIVEHGPDRALRNLAKTVSEFTSRPLIGHVYLVPVLIWFIGRGLTRRRSQRGKITA